MVTCASARGFGSTDARRALAGAPEQGPEALTQAIGRLAVDLDLQALLVPSAARKGGSNFILFPANLDPPKSSLRIVNKKDLPKKT